MKGPKSNTIIDMKETGQRIKQIMEEKNLTVRDLQKHLGISTTQGIYHWFKGRNLPSIDNLYALSELFEVPIDAMVCGNRKSNFVVWNQKDNHRLYAYYFSLIAC